MIDRPKDPQKERRAQRLSAALRDNLKRRKAQARGRNSGPGVDRSAASAQGDLSTEAHDSAEFADEKRNN